MKMISILSCFFCVSSVVAQTGREDGIGMQLIKLPITKISILSSGLAYYEHSGTVNGPAVIELPFKASAINDALKSLIVNDSATANPSVLYQSEQTLIQTLRSLKIDLSGNPDMAAVLRGLRGAEIELTVQSQKESGRIVGVEFRAVSDDVQEAWLSLNTGQGIKMFNFKDINSIVFKDPQLASDLNRALDLIASSRNTDLRNLSVRLPGNGSRNVTISYVIPAPVWKVSYRLDFGSDANAKPLLQGWAIVDNDSDFDWSSVRLSLIAG
ncbi:MAG: DUF4139 domain-containing protein, partial [Treponema sp.]|nr:DUF4139 domain-containing protein [Treponema sp.]